MRATILVTTTPGGGPELCRALADDPNIKRRFATLGSHEFVCEVVADGQQALLETIARINACPQQLSSETLLDMETQQAPHLVADSAKLAKEAKA